MNSYRIHAPYFVALVTGTGGIVCQAPPILGWAVGRSMLEFNQIVDKHGWKIEPVPEYDDISGIWLNGAFYEIVWNGETVLRVTKHEEGESKDLTYRQLPAEIRLLL